MFALPRIVRTLIRTSLTLRHMKTIRSAFLSWRITANFFSTLIVFRRFVTWTTLGGGDFSMTLVRKPNTVEKETR